MRIEYASIKDSFILYIIVLSIKHYEAQKDVEAASDAMCSFHQRISLKNARHTILQRVNARHLASMQRFQSNPFLCDSCEQKIKIVAVSGDRLLSNLFCFKDKGLNYFIIYLHPNLCKVCNIILNFFLKKKFDLLLYSK